MEKKTKEKNKTGAIVFKIIAIVLVCSILLVLLVLLSAHLFVPPIYYDFFSKAEEAYVTPGMDSKTVLQGYTYVDADEVFLHTGYMSDDSASRIYIVDANDTSKVRYVELKNSDGSAYTGQVGGIANANGFVWITKSEGDEGVWVLSLAEILKCKNGDSIKLDTLFDIHCSPAFCHADGEYLWIGEFSDDGKYKTSEKHHFNVAGGEKNKGIITLYKLDKESNTGIDGELPEKIISICDKVQGMTIIPGKSGKADRIVFATSYSVSASHLIFYNDVTMNKADSKLNIDGTDIPVWFFDDENLEQDIKMQPMAEGIILKEKRIYVSFESASQKYIFGNFTRGRHVYSYKYK